MTNVAEILQDYPKGTKLYSPICGECELESVNNGELYSIAVTFEKKEGGKGEVSFTEQGYYLLSAKHCECLLWPSDDNRDWETMRKPAFKPGDIVVTSCDGIAILDRQRETPENWWYAVCLNKKYGRLDRDIFGEPVRLAYTYEIAELLKELTKRGLCYNSETHALEEIKKEHIFQPYDKVLVRDSNSGVWKADLFSHKNGDASKYPYAATNGSWMQCIPYEGNEYLVGTTDNPVK